MMGYDSKLNNAELTEELRQYLAGGESKTWALTERRVQEKLEGIGGKDAAAIAERYVTAPREARRFLLDILNYSEFLTRNLDERCTIRIGKGKGPNFLDVKKEPDVIYIKFGSEESKSGFINSCGNIHYVEVISSADPKRNLVQVNSSKVPLGEVLQDLVRHSSLTFANLHYICEAVGIKPPSREQKDRIEGKFAQQVEMC